MKISDIVFWLIIVGIIAIALWLLSGSPTEIGAIIGIATFVGASEILLWKALFQIDKRTAIGFEKVSSDFKIMRNDLENKHREIKKELLEIKEMIN